MPQNTQMASMDLDSIIESEIGTQAAEEPVNSDTQPTQPAEPANPPAPEGNGDTNGDTLSSEGTPEPEAEETEPQGGQNKRPFSRLEKAEYSATKWKRKAKNLQKERDKIAAEFERYKNLNPAVFRNPEERMQFMAWRAQTAQRLNDMDEDLQAFAQDEAEEAYEEKVAQCYNDPKLANGFRQLDEHYSPAFEYMCREVDPDGIILDFLKDSPYEPAMRNVIFKNGALQEELFRAYRNPQIGNAKRQQILQRLEAQVKAFYERESQKRLKKTAPAAPAATAEPKGTETRAPGQQAGAERTPKYTLPPRKEVPPAQAPAPAAKPKPQVTGVLTRGDGSGAGEPDVTAQADALFNQLYGARA